MLDSIVTLSDQPPIELLQVDISCRDPHLLNPRHSDIPRAGP